MTKNKKISSLVHLAIIGAIAVATIQLWASSTKPASIASTDTAAPQSVPLVIQKAQSFDFADEKTSLTQNQLDQHKKLYQGYVNKRNEVEQKLASIDTSDANNMTYSAFRSLKLAETFARNGAILHELYFENLKQGTTMGPKTKDFLTRGFGSIDAFKKDLMACASSSRGWAIAFYEIDNKRMHNYVLEAHNETVPLLCVPIIVIDIYEHAYMIDYGIDRAKYLKELWASIDWEVVERRITDLEVTVAPEKEICM